MHQPHNQSPITPVPSHAPTRVGLLLTGRKPQHAASALALTTVLTALSWTTSATLPGGITVGAFETIGTFGLVAAVTALAPGVDRWDHAAPPSRRLDSTALLLFTLLAFVVIPVLVVQTLLRLNLMAVLIPSLTPASFSAVNPNDLWYVSTNLAVLAGITTVSISSLGPKIGAVATIVAMVALGAISRIESLAPIQRPTSSHLPTPHLIPAAISLAIACGLWYRWGGASSLAIRLTNTNK